MEGRKAKEGEKGEEVEKEGSWQGRLRWNRAMLYWASLESYLKSLDLSLPVFLHTYKYREQRNRITKSFVSKFSI